MLIHEIGWITNKQVNPMSDNHIGLTTLDIGVSICLKAYTFGLALIVVFKNPERCCSYHQPYNFTTSMFVKELARKEWHPTIVGNTRFLRIAYTPGTR